MLNSFFSCARHSLGLRAAGFVLLSLLITACSNAPLVPPEKPPVTMVDPVARAAVPAPVPVPPRVGLALGGGAARGFAHIGVIQVLEEQGIKVDLVAGTSAGSLVAALYASGLSGREMAVLAEGMDEGSITDWAFPTRGLIRGEALARYVREKTGAKQIEQMKLPLGIVATDLADGSGILFQRGDTGAAVRASSSVPAVFQPVKIGSREYVDGGLVAPVPVRYARQMGAELVIAVDISSPPEAKPGSDAIRMLLQTFSIMGRSINNFELREADVVLRPKLDGFGSADFTVRKQSVQAGREAALAMLPQIRAKIAAKTR
ncbi:MULTISPECIES: patatin-like phospholipase family protein [Roseateles]|uniref:Patatin-like phospholipase family protein n=1 Tax=Roseateles albus TaxID=2987525 RepID=A0ABT5K9L2_9BURK|nr:MULTISPECIES: patatin-like phospholipase family protein [Roseateles]MCV2357540.1 patatin-like phospholipase family protein [Paucibacter sp. TC2R-5]MDC8770602.1 patatin-like phospholipase family protein [Roseateles albus]